ncbi:phosphoglycerol transferase MdoB-like AlkP superfamily enzyme [Alkalibacillus flavidus]|uniref:Phosphoglycerol transferase MdoB-like AlkP superfamily enzyme n=1 Tax=Alkalibacillus flavidus TaxID=546021 RepID=A0ABV2KS82_9BACI
MGNDDRKQVIIDEIKHWKKSKLLPAEYCDFLLALYTFGEGVEEENDQSVKKKNRKQALIYLDVIFLLLLLPASLLMSVVVELNVAVDLSLSVLILIILIGHVYWFRRRASSMIHIPVMLVFLVLLISSISFINTLYGQGMLLNGVIAVHCVLWVIIGIYWRYYYLTASGIVGIMLLASMIFL